MVNRSKLNEATRRARTLRENMERTMNATDTNTDDYGGGVAIGNWYSAEDVKLDAEHCKKFAEIWRGTFPAQILN